MNEPLIETFGSAEEMFAVMAQREDAANAHLSDTQRELRDDVGNDRCWVRLYPSPGEPGGTLPIFGRTWALAEAERRERAYYPDPFPDAESAAEYAYIAAGLRERRERGYLYGYCYSVVEPDGELGDTHVSSVLPLTAEAFAEAEAARWDVRALPVDGLVWTAFIAAASA